MIRIRRTRRVRPDLLHIWRWIARDNPSAASRTLHQINDAFRLISDFPEAAARRDDIGENVRTFPVGRYLVVYRIDEHGPLILRIIHGAMDLTQVDLE